MTYPNIGEAWVPKRGRRHLTPIIVRNVHRADRSVLVVDEAGRRREVPVRDLRRDYKPWVPTWMPTLR